MNKQKLQEKRRQLKNLKTKKRKYKLAKRKALYQAKKFLLNSIFVDFSKEDEKEVQEEIKNAKKFIAIAKSMPQWALTAQEKYKYDKCVDFVEHPIKTEEEKLKNSLEYFTTRARNIAEWKRKDYVNEEYKKYKLFLQSEKFKKEEEKNNIMIDNLKKKIDKTINDISIELDKQHDTK